MATPRLTNETRDLYISRLNQMSSDSERHWGELTPTGLMAHLTKTFEVSMGEIKLPDQSNLFSRTIMKWLIVYVLPWPKGKIKAPPVFTPEPQGDFDQERISCISALDRYLAMAQESPNRKVLHPFVGPITLAFWGKIHGLHLDHHLRQFGV